MHLQPYFQTTQDRATLIAPQPGSPPPVSRLTAGQERLMTPQDPSCEQRAGRLRQQLEAVRLGARGAASWLESSRHYAQLLNGDGVVPLTARFDARDLQFLGGAREQLLGFAELGLRLVDLHQPLDGGGITTNQASPILRCRSCMWRWPCPTFRLMAELLEELRPELPG